LWIGDAVPTGALPGIAKRAGVLPDGFWPLPDLVMPKSSLEWIPGGEKWPFVRSPFTKGQHRPFCNATFVTEDGANDPLPLLQLRGPDGKVMTVGLAWPRKAPRAVFYPAYALWPRLFTPGETVGTPTEPRLDAVGRELLDRALDLLKAPAAK